MVRCIYPLLRREHRLAIRARWCRATLYVLGVELSVEGSAPDTCQLIAANHISWLDVFVLGAVFPCWYVAKAETRSWPVAGWIAAANDTLFLKRASARAVYRMNGEIRARLQRGDPVVVFPEGTTTDGTGVLDFHPALFQPAIDCDVPVLPLAIGYRDDRSAPATAVAYINDDPLWLSLRAVLDAPRIQARLMLRAALDGQRHRRRDLAGLTCHAIRQAMTEPVPARAGRLGFERESIRPVVKAAAAAQPE